MLPKINDYKFLDNWNLTKEIFKELSTLDDPLNPLPLETIIAKALQNKLDLEGIQTFKDTSKHNLSYTKNKDGSYDVVFSHETNINNKISGIGFYLNLLKTAEDFNPTPKPKSFEEDLYENCHFI